MVKYLSYLHFFCFITYVYIIAYILFKNPKSLITRISAALFLSFAVWSYCFIHIHNPNTALSPAKMFLRISSLGGISSSGIFLLFCWIYTEMYKRIKMYYVFIALIVPLLLILLQWHPAFEIMKINEGGRFPYGWDTYFEHSVFSLIFLVYSYVYALTGFYLLYRYYKKTPYPMKRKQVKIILLGGVVIVLFTIFLTMLSEWEKYHAPFMGDIVYVIWSFVILQAITKYQLFSLNPSTAAEKLIETMSDTLLLIDKDGIIVHVNSASHLLFAGDKGYLIGQSVKRLFGNGNAGSDNIYELLQKGIVQNLATWCVTKDGREVPVLFSSSPMYDKNGIVQGIVCVIRDMTEQRRLEKEVIEVESRQKLRVSHDLHDGLGQHLTGVALGCKALEEKLSSGLTINISDIAEVTLLVRQAVEMVQNLSKGLSPVEMQSGGLVLALRDLSKTTESMFSISCTFSHDVSLCLDNEVVATHMYRIAQEAITNAVKHGRANHIVLSLTQRDNKILLNVIDNGNGIPDKSQRNPGMGLRIMNYRAHIIGGTLDVYREPTGGTVVTCIV